MDFEIGNRVKVRLAGGGLWAGEIKGIRWSTAGRKSSSPVPEYYVELDGVGKASGDYYKEFDLILDTSKDFKWVLECTCGANSAYAPHKAPGHAYHCDMNKNNKPKVVF